MTTLGDFMRAPAVSENEGEDFTMTEARNGDFPDDTCGSIEEAARHHGVTEARSIMCDSGKLTCGYVGIPHVAACWEVVK